MNIPLVILLQLGSIFCFSQKTISLQFYFIQPLPLQVYFDSAEYFYDKSEFRKAIKYVEQGIREAENLKAMKQIVQGHLILGKIRSKEEYFNAAVVQFKESLNIINEEGIDDSLKVFVLTQIADSYLRLDKFDSAIYYSYESINLDKNQKHAIQNFTIIGVSHRNIGNYDKAIEAYFKALKLADDQENINRKARVLINIGALFAYGDETQKALKYFQESVLLLENLKDNSTLALLFTNIANIYVENNQFDLAMINYNQALNITDKLNLRNTRASILQNIGSLYASQNQYLKALEYYERSRILERELGRTSYLIYNLKVSGEASLQLNKIQKARGFLNEAQILATELGAKPELVGIYKHLSELDSASGNFESALINYKRSKQLENDIIGLKKSGKIEELREKYESEQKENMIVKQKLQIQKQKGRYILFVTLTSIIFLAFLAIYFYFRYTQKVKHGKEIQKQNNLRLQAIVTTQEQVQQKIARDLHDGLGQILAAAKISLESVIQTDNSENIFAEKIKSATIKSATQIIDEACQETRNISHQLLPYSLKKEGLLSAITELVKKNLEGKIKFPEFKHFGNIGRCKELVEINLYRIIQELINNVIKHANAEKVSIQLAQNHKNLVLWVEDNGIGFIPESEKNGVGLLNIKSRLQLINGTINIESNPGIGTTTTIRIPLNESH